jgi:DNA invertase Pin-like site-specific DNA recombinase
VVFCDLPTIPEGPVGKFLITQMASVAELEAGLISQRTKVALAASKARGTKLGGLRSSSERIAEIAAAGRKAQSAEAAKGRAALLPVIADIRSTMPNASLRQIAAELDARGETTPRGGAWSAVQVLRVLERTTKAA